MPEGVLDPLLVPYVNARMEEDAERLLSVLLRDHADPVIADILRYKFRAGRASHGALRAQGEIEDVTHEAQISLLTHVRRLRLAQDPVVSFRGYVAVVTYNAFNEYMRRKYPARTRLRNRLRYVLTHGTDLAMWSPDGHTSWCGLASWRSLPLPIYGGARVEELVEGGRAVAATIFPGIDVRVLHLRQVLDGIFEWLGQPLEFDRLVAVVAEMTDVREEQIASTPETDAEIQPDPHPNASVALEQREYLRALWSEIRALPERQRVALIFGLPDLDALQAAGIARIRDIAAAVAVPDVEFAAMWNALPWSDMRIAQHLLVTRQQVINLRKCARERLERRMERRRINYVV